jgi:hypothetical protein
MGTGLYVNVTDGNSHLSPGHKRGKKVRLSKHYLKILVAYILGGGTEGVEPATS